MNDSMADGRVWLDDRQTAALLKVRRKRVHELRADHSGSFPRARRSATGTLIWSHDEVAEWAEDRDRALSTRKLPVAPAAPHEASRLLRAILPLLSAAMALGVSLLMWRQRVDDHVTNVDDYLYARQSKTILDSLVNDGHGIVDTWREFGVNSPLVPTLAAPLAAGDASPSHLVLVQLPLVLALGWVLAVLLKRVGMGPGRWLLAGLLVIAPPVLTYTPMLSFSIAATLGVVGALAAYLASRRLRSRPAAVGLGVALGLLSLSRVVALVYLAALVVPMVVDLLLDREDVEERVVNAATTSLIATAIAAPWWLTAGPKALRYLFDAGYSSDSVFVSDRSLLGTLEDRFTHTADETGWLLALAVLAVFVVGVALAAAHTRSQTSERGRGIFVGAASCVLGMLALGTSSNAGTAFAMPYVVLMAALGVAGIALHLEGRWLPVRTVLALLTVAGLGVSTFAVFSDSQPDRWGPRQLWLSGTPARAQVESALGCTDCALPDADRVNREIFARIGTAPTAILRADALVNPESLRFLGAEADTPVTLTAPAGSTLEAGTLAVVRFAVGGRTAAPYLGVNLPGADTALTAAGFCVVLTEQLSEANSVVLWSKDCPTA